jgi:uncharacterized protein (DUF1786 family)
MSKSQPVRRSAELSTKTIMGGGAVAPAVAVHLKRSQPDAPPKVTAKTATAPATSKTSTFGGGSMAPSVARHLKG